MSLQNAKPYAGQTAEQLIFAGYRQVSRAFRTVARVEVSDEEMYAFYVKENFGSETSSLPKCSLEDQRDHWRRCHSKDSIEGVPESVMKRMRELG